MCTEARPVRVDARLAPKSSTAFSILDFSCCWASLRAGILPITETAMFVLLPELDRHCLLARVVRGTNQRPRLHVTEPHAQSFLTHVGESLRRVVASHRQVVFRWTQILSNR